MMAKLTVEICVGTSCHMLGAQDLSDAVEALPIEQRRQIDLREVACFTGCGKGPNVRINGNVFLGMTPEVLVGLINKYLV